MVLYGLDFTCVCDRVQGSGAVRSGHLSRRIKGVELQGSGEMRCQEVVLTESQHPCHTWIEFRAKRQSVKIAVE